MAKNVKHVYIGIMIDKDNVDYIELCDNITEAKSFNYYLTIDESNIKQVSTHLGVVKL